MKQEDLLIIGLLTLGGAFIDGPLPIADVFFIPAGLGIIAYALIKGK